MLAKTFYDMNKNEYDNDYYRYSYMYPEVYDNKFKKYELLDGVNFILDGIFVRKRLQGIVLRDSESSSEDGCFKAEKLSKTIRKKFGDPIETSKDSANYIAKWLRQPNGFQDLVATITIMFGIRLTDPAKMKNGLL